MDREVRNMKGRLITWAGALGAVGCAIQVLKHLPFVSVLFMHNVPWSDGTTETVYVDYSPAVLTWAVLLGAAFLCLGRSEHPRVRRMSKVGVVACIVLSVPPSGFLQCFASTRACRMLQIPRPCCLLWDLMSWVMRCLQWQFGNLPN